jgi:outer membrane protein TolC
MASLFSSASRTTFSFTAFILVSVCSCSAPGPKPLDFDALASDVDARGASPEQVIEALRLAEFTALPLERPVLQDPPAYDSGAFWQASALAFNGELRAARRRWLAASARANAAGAPVAAELEVEQSGFASSDRETWIALTFDVLSFFDAGRSAAAVALSKAEARTALADVEGAAWNARFAVDRARAELGTSLTTIESLSSLLDSAGASVERARLLFERGRLSESDFARLSGMVGEVDHALHTQRQDLSTRRRELADATGLPSSASALDAPTRATLDDLSHLAALPRLPDARELLERSPLLRRARLEYAVAEAILRDEVARTRPGVRLGPALDVRPDETLPGGMLVIDLPHARALSGRVEAARQTREQVREELEETLRSSLARIEQARTQYETARQALAGHALAREAETDVAWRAARARFQVDPAAAEQVGMALRDRAMALSDLFDVRREIVLAWLNLEELIGPEPRPLPNGEPLADARTLDGSEVRP